MIETNKIMVALIVTLIIAAVIALFTMRMDTTQNLTDNDSLAKPASITTLTFTNHTPVKWTRYTHRPPISGAQGTQAKLILSANTTAKKQAALQATAALSAR